ncbi:MAG: hypothetical protein Q9182_007486 [Xanthomendoza sp. 2 TL-2023]
MSPTISLHVSIHISPTNLPTFLSHFKTCFQLAAAEPECTYFEVFIDPEDAGHLCWVENWGRGREWFMSEQITKPYYKPYLEATEPMFIKPREFAFYERLGEEWIV